MALKLGTLQVDVEANTSDFKKGEREVTQGAKRITRSFKIAATALATFVGVRAARDLLFLADGLAVAERRVQLLSDTTFEANNNLQSLKNTANDTGQSFTTVFSIFEGFKRIQDDINATDQEILDFTDALNKLGIIGGSSGEEISNALRQLNQGLAGGILRAEEFNSIVENTPEVARAIANGLNVSLGELRALVLEGEVLANDVFEAILSQVDEVNNRFEQTPKSLNQQFQESKNLLLDILGSIDSLVGASQFFGEVWGKANEQLAKLALSVKNIKDLTLEEARAREEANLNDIKTFNERIKLLREEVALEERLGQVNGATLGKRVQIQDLEEERQALIEKGVQLQEQIFSLLTQQTQEEIQATQAVAARNEEAEKLRETYESFNLAEFLETENLKISLNEANEEFERTLATIQEISQFDDAFESLEQDIANFEEFVKEANNELLNDSLNTAQALTSTWGDTFGNILQLAQSFQDRRINSEIEAVKQSTNLSEEEKEERIKQLEDERAKRDKLQRTAFVAKKLFNVAEIAIDTARNVVAAGGLTPLGTAQGAFGATQAAIVAAQPAPGRQFGGNVAANSLVPVNENGDPELLTMGNNQFLLTGSQNGRVTSGANMATGGGMPNVTVINQAPGVEVVPQSITRDEVLLIARRAENAAVNRINRSISTNQGSTAKALRSARTRG